MAKRANKRRKNGKGQRTAARSIASTKRTTAASKHEDAAPDDIATTAPDDIAIAAPDDIALTAPDDDPLDDPLEDPLEDPFFYESPFPPEVVLEELAPPPAVYTPAILARRRKLRTFVAMVVGAAATIMLLGLGQTMW